MEWKALDSAGWKMFFEKLEKGIDKRRKICFTNDENSLIIKVIQKAYKK